MSYSKANLFPSGDQKTAALAKSIAHPARISILRLLAQSGPVNSKFLLNRLPLSAPTIQQHLNFLISRNIVVVNTQPLRALYSIRSEQINHLHGVLDQCFRDLADPMHADAEYS